MVKRAKKKETKVLTSKAKRLSNFTLGVKLGQRYSLIDRTGKSKLVRDKTTYKVSRFDKISRKGKQDTYSGSMDLYSEKGRFLQSEFFIVNGNNLRNVKKKLKKRYYF